MTRLGLPAEAEAWWDAELADQGELVLELHEYKERRGRIGRLRPGPLLFRFDPEGQVPGAQALHEELPTFVGNALVRAGWARPLLDPAAWRRVVAWRNSGDRRLEFVLDTNAMSDGSGHWLACTFSDRCDLLVTAVTLRELHDAGDRMRPKKGEEGKRKSVDEAIKNRQRFLSASRFREFVGLKRIIWRELEIDDTALLLSRGGKLSNEGGKMSESDTALLRVVRRSINERVRGLERVFVTGDTNLARRATTELPDGSVFATKPLKASPGATYFPASWWPGPSGQGVAWNLTHPVRLLWELLALGEAIVLRADDGRAWKLRAYDPSGMWPSDYLKPWLDVEEQRPRPVPAAAVATVPAIAPEPAPVADPDPPLESPEEATTRAASGRPRPGRAAQGGRPGGQPETGWSGAQAHAERSAPSHATGPQVSENLRVVGPRILDLLAALSTSDAQPRLPKSLLELGEDQRREYERLFRGLELAELGGDRAGRLKRLAQAEEVRRCWSSQDVDGLGAILRGYEPLDELLRRGESDRPKKTVQGARGLAVALDQAAMIEGQWLPGADPIEPTAVRQAILARFDEQGTDRALLVHDLLVDVLLRGLRMSPQRVLRRWRALQEAGVFEQIEPRTGGTSSGQRHVASLVLVPGGYRHEKLDLEEVGGWRDLVDRRPRGQ